MKNMRALSFKSAFYVLNEIYAALNCCSFWL
jgi:hypothetical protein